MLSRHALAVPFALAVLATACKSSSGGDAPAQQPTSGTQPSGGKVATDTKVTAFAIHEENLTVDKISMRDGSINPDGNRDLVFTATVEGPADALYLVTCDEKGEPVHGFRADTIAGHEELPRELAAAGQVDIGRLTVWIAIVENGKFINDDRGKLAPLSAGPHTLKLYVPNTGTLRSGSRLRLYARAPGGALAAGPVINY